MIDLAFKNITRQRTRTFLTVLGIVIGIGAIVALGSISEGLNREVQQGLELNAGKIIVTESGSGGIFGALTGGELTDEHVEEIAGVTGVKEVVPIAYYAESMNPLQGFGWMAIGVEPEKTAFVTGESIVIETGRNLEENDDEVIVIGNTFAETNNLDVGDFFTILETDLEVVGVLEKADVTDIDNNLMLPLDVLQDITEEDTYPMIYAVPEDLRDVEFIAERIEDTNEDLGALTSTDIARQASQILNQVRLMTFGIGAVAALVGGLGIMNTMIMSVLERKREIGVMKAVGATQRQILIHFLTESLLIAAFGGAIGIVLGIGGSMLLGFIIGFGSFATVTPILAGGAFIFALVLGLLGGFYPSWKASRLDPVVALRYE